jgi:hypothetical protein
MRIPYTRILLAGLTVLAGCSAAPSQTQEALIQKQSAPYRQRGNSTIAGRAFLLAPDGRQIPASAEEVYLTPVTTWAESRVASVLASNEIPEADDRAAEVWWTARADATGRFSFEELAAGQYFVLAPIAYASGGDAAHLIAVARVTLGPRQKLNVEVTRRIATK